MKKIQKAGDSYEIRTYKRRDSGRHRGQLIDRPKFKVNETVARELDQYLTE